MLAGGQCGWLVYGGCGVHTRCRSRLNPIWQQLWCGTQPVLARVGSLDQWLAVAVARPEGRRIGHGARWAAALVCRLVRAGRVSPRRSNAPTIWWGKTGLTDRGLQIAVKQILRHNYRQNSANSSQTQLTAIRL